MKRLMTFALVALLSLGVASVSLAQAPAGGQAAGDATSKAGKKHKAHKKSGKKHKKKDTAAEPAK